MNDEMLEKLAIREVIDNWVVWSDSGDWERFRTVWHEGAFMSATWFEGTAEEFVRVRREGFEKGVSIIHFLGGSSIEVAGNRAVANGTLGTTISKILEELKPEAAYFAEDNGQRTGYIFFDMKDASQLPAIAEPWFLAFNARLTVRPAMNAQDLAKAGPAIEHSAKAYGKGA